LPAPAPSDRRGRIDTARRARKIIDFMPRKAQAPLPDQLKYLRPFVRSLAKLPPEELNEDVDASRLEAALRRRLSGLDEDAADAALAEDRQLLETWLKNEASGDHPAYWVLGYLLSPDIAAHLTRPAEPPPRGPVMSFDAPEGWEVKIVPFRLDLKKGKVIGSIQAIDAVTLGHFRAAYEAPAPPVGIAPPGIKASSQSLEVSFGPCAGTKYLRVCSAPVPGKQMDDVWKQVDYLLSVPGGYVFVFLGTVTGVDFDETELESRLHTVTLSPPA
jgi:hypothetical protein